ncbi:MAG: ribosome maturation factor RimP [Cytophagales bacterium]
MKKELLQLVEDNFPKEKFFIVDISLVMLRDTPKIKITADSDSGIGIDECAEISRSLYKLIEESGITENYEIEISSPGVGEPLKLDRQYVKNIGRTVKMVGNDGKTITGKLIGVISSQQIDIEEVIKVKGKKEPEIVIHKIPFSDIKKTTVEVSFN